MKKRIINAADAGNARHAEKAVPSESRNRLESIRIDAIGLIMLPVPDLYFYADLASKSAHVAVSEIFGSCPQHITTLALFGEIAAVNEAMRIIEDDDSTF